MPEILKKILSHERGNPMRLLCLVFVVSTIFYAKGEIEWLGKQYDFGAFKEAEGPRTGSLSFVNKGPDPVLVNMVRTSCGCTDASYPKEMIQPGDTATVSFTYNPKGRPGGFSKTVKVFIGKDNDLHILKITGTVIGAPTTLQFSYPAEAGPLRLEREVSNAGEVKRGASRHIFINAYNQSSDTVRPSLSCSSRAIDPAITPAAIPPGEIATISLYLRTLEEKIMGPVEYKVLLTGDGDGQPFSKELTAKAVIVPDTDGLSVEEIDRAPRAYLVPEFVDFGEIKEDGKVKFRFQILNDGQSDLMVSRVYTEAEGVKIKKKPSRVKSGKKGEVSGELNLSKIPSGPFRLLVEVMTNDPLHPLRTAHLVGIRQ